MKTYTVADLRKDTRKVLNEAAVEPVQITRYDETFVLSKANGETFKPGETKVPGGKVINSPSEVTENLPSDVKFCKHGAAPGFCKVQKCPNSKRA